MRGKKKERKKKRPRKHLKASITTPHVLLYISQQDESNNTKKDHQ